MSPRDLARNALELKPPTGMVPTFELEFQLAPELLGRDYEPYWEVSGAEREASVNRNAELAVEIAERLDYAIIRTHSIETLARLKAIGAGERFLLCGESDGTMGIPDGDTMEALVEEIFERPEETHPRLTKSMEDAIRQAERIADAGGEMITMCADYCFNQAPFLSPKLFAEFVTPYLAQSIEHYRKLGLLVVKHTDGNIMPILDQLVSANPHGLHSLDPQAGVDIAEVKRLYGDRLCLCGNVNCALMQTGSEAEVRQSAEYALRSGMPGGGYIYCTSNVAFRGLPLERYLGILEIRKELGNYGPG